MKSRFDDSSFSQRRGFRAGERLDPSQCLLLTTFEVIQAMNLRIISFVRVLQSVCLVSSVTFTTALRHPGYKKESRSVVVDIDNSCGMLQSVPLFRLEEPSVQ